MIRIITDSTADGCRLFYAKGKRMIREAAAFAAKAHEGTFRKGSGIPYIYHPLEVALIVAQMTEDEELIAAAYLHDVLEDTSVEPELIEKLFGQRVLRLVLAETEDKSLCWRERKEATIRHLDASSQEVKTLTLGDKLSNMRSTARDYLAIGDVVWQRFNEKDRECHKWYYAGVVNGLREFNGNPAYEELKSLYEFVFGA